MIVYGTTIHALRQRAALAEVASHAVPLAEVDRAFQIASDKSAGAVKVTVLPEAS